MVLEITEEVDEKGLCIPPPGLKSPMDPRHEPSIALPDGLNSHLLPPSMGVASICEKALLLYDEGVFEKAVE